jgi:hypothetical protein
MKKNKTPEALARDAAHRAKADEIRKAKATARALAKAEAIAAKELDREAWRAKAVAAGRRIPAGFSDWGYIQTKAWAYFAGRCAKAAATVRPSREKLQDAIATVERISTLTPAECAALLGQHDPAAL